MGRDLEKWLAHDGEEFLREIGIREGQNILDFGCGDGVYVLPAAKVAGTVYAADIDKNAIDSLMKTAESQGLRNIIPLVTDTKINLENNSIDAVLLYDVLHYLNKEQREELYSEVRRILRYGSILSVYPKHNKSDWPMWNLSDMGVDDIIKEIESHGFRLEGKYRKKLIHNGEYEGGMVLNFRKISLKIAFGTDDGENLSNGHFGSAKFYHIYQISNKKSKFVEEMENLKIEEDETIGGGDPKKAKATASILKGIDVLVGRRFGPNITRMLKKFACVVVKTDSIENAVRIVENNIDKIAEELNKGEERKHLILREEK